LRNFEVPVDETAQQADPPAAAKHCNQMLDPSRRRSSSPASFALADEAIE
jgi:hypothetical protein